MLSVLCLNGPNLDLLGTRQPEVYGEMTLEELESQVLEWGRRLGFEVHCRQSNREGDVVEAVHAASGYAGVVLNPGALTHTSAALGDAVAGVDTPVVEVHLSNVRSRDRWRRRSYVAPAAVATIFGRGPEGYRAALRHLANRRARPIETYRYGPHPDQVFDVRRAPSRSLGFVLLHGGFWLDAWGRDTTEAWAIDLADRGFPSVNLEFRRLGSGGGMVPTLSDVSRGVAAAARLLETDAVVVAGHSAGAHLAVNVGVRSDFPGQAVMSISGVLDLEEAAVAGRGDGAAAGFDPDGGTSPLTLRPPGVPVVVAHGAADTVVPPDHSRRYGERLAGADTPHRVSLVEGVGHFDALDPSSGLWERALSDLKELGIG